MASDDFSVYPRTCFFIVNINYVLAPESLNARQHLHNTTTNKLGVMLHIRLGGRLLARLDGLVEVGHHLHSNGEGRGSVIHRNMLTL